MTTFKKAVKYDAKLRLALVGPSGSGKTMTALILGQRLAKVPGGKLAVIDTERGSASKYADQYDFDVLELDSYHPQKYIEAIQAASKAGYTVLVVDSLSHAWSGKDGALEMVDREASKMKAANNFAAWRTVTPWHNKLVDALIGATMHLIVTMRSKIDYVQTQDERGRTVIKKIGMQPVQRDGMEYEFDVVGEMDLDHILAISKTRCSLLVDAVFPKPDGALADILQGWLQGTEQRPPQEARSAPAASAPTPTPAPPAATPQRRPRPAGFCDGHRADMFKSRSGKVGHLQDGQPCFGIPVGERCLHGRGVNEGCAECAADAAAADTQADDTDGLPPSQVDEVAALRDDAEAKGWEWAEFMSNILGCASWEEWVALGGTVAVAQERGQL